MTDVGGRVAVVTGGGRGIGAATCRRLSEAGARVVVAEIDAESGQGVADEITDGVFIETDVACEDSVREMVSRVVEELGGIDILVNNAGIDIEQANPGIEEVGIDLLEHVFAVNTLGTVRVCKALLPLVRKSTLPTRGLIANTTSGLASMSNPVMMTRYGYMMSKVSITMRSLSPIPI